MTNSRKSKSKEFAIGLVQFISRSRLRRLIDRLRCSPVECDLGHYQQLVCEINERESSLNCLEDQQIVALSRSIKVRAREGVPLDFLLVEAYALGREASRRALRQRHFDAQVLAGIAMHQGKLAEMQTGEGKTLAAVLPAYLNALSGEGVHVLTFNDYLARRDASWMGSIYKFLGLTVGFVQEGMNQSERRQAYLDDITYLTAKEAGFDYLRDCLCYQKSGLVHRPFHFAIVDEADSILVDEARIPLVLAGSSVTPQADLYRLAAIARELKSKVDYDTDEYARNLSLTEVGIERVQAVLRCGDLYSAHNLGLLTRLNLALQAEALLKRDVDYIVRNRNLELVDELTGRVVDDRHWPDGLQTALEAKENLSFQPQGQILSSITLQHFLQFYPKLCGMTATAQPAADELKEIYGLNTVVIPPSRPSIRIDHPDEVFTHKEAKIRVLVEEIAHFRSIGRPILVGTSTVNESDLLAAELQEAGIGCQVLNAKTDELEAHIVAQAGSYGAVTISTNMAGRGTDIRLGGEQEEDKERVATLGGLYVIGTNKHESLRIDHQLRGRAGRQGDPGCSRFFISLEDDLIERYGVRQLLPFKHRPLRQEGPINDPVIRSEIARAQRIIEGQNFEIRKTLWKYSSLLEQQRQILLSRREDVLFERVPLCVLKTQAPKLYSEACSLVGEFALQSAEKQMTLFHIDHCWADHLARIAEIREGIHLVRLSGKNPLDEFQKRVTEIFSELPRSIDEKILQSFHSVEISDRGIDLDKAGLKGPSSTWTYLVNDNPFKDGMEVLLGGNIGLAAVAGSYLPTMLLLSIWAIYRKLLLRRGGKSE